MLNRLQGVTVCMCFVRYSQSVFRLPSHNSHHAVSFSASALQAQGSASVGRTAEILYTAGSAAKQPSSAAVQTSTVQSPTSHNSQQHGTHPVAQGHQGQQRLPPNTPKTQPSSSPQSSSQQPPVKHFARHTRPLQQPHQHQHHQQTSPVQPASVSASASGESSAQVPAPQSAGSWLKLPPKSPQPQTAPVDTTTPRSAGELRTSSHRPNGVPGQDLAGYGLTNAGRQEQQHRDQVQHQAQLWIEQQTQRVQQQSTGTPGQQSTGMLQRQGTTGTPGPGSSPPAAARAQAPPVAGALAVPAAADNTSGLDRTPLPPTQPTPSKPQQHSRQQQPSTPSVSTSHPGLPEASTTMPMSILLYSTCSTLTCVACESGSFSLHSEIPQDSFADGFEQMPTCRQATLACSCNTQPVLSALRDPQEPQKAQSHPCLSSVVTWEQALLPACAHAGACTAPAVAVGNGGSRWDSTQYTTKQARQSGDLCSWYHITLR